MGACDMGRELVTVGIPPILISQRWKEKFLHILDRSPSLLDKTISELLHGCPVQSVERGPRAATLSPSASFFLHFLRTASRYLNPKPLMEPRSTSGPWGV